MGSGGPASETILFIGAIVVATAVVGAVTAVAQSTSNDLRDRGRILSTSLRSDITIINDPLAVPTAPLTLYVKNTGSATLHSQFVDVLLDGVVSTDVSFDVLGSPDDEVWRPGEVLELTVNDLAVTPGDHRARVVAHTGAEDTLEFHA